MDDEVQAALERARERCRQVAAEMPIFDQGSEANGHTRVLAGGWFTVWDTMAWHEAGHAVAFAAQGWIVEFVTIDPNRSLSEGQGSCTAVPPVLPDKHTIAKVRALASCAGNVGARMVLVGLGLEDMKSDVTKMSPSDHATVAASCQVMTGGALTAAFVEECQRVAAEILYAHKEIYGVLVAALVERRSLEQQEIHTVLSGGCLAPLRH